MSVPSPRTRRSPSLPRSAMPSLVCAYPPSSLLELLPVGQRDVPDHAGRPFLAGWLRTVASSPGLNKRRDHPRFERSAMLAEATDQVLTVPSAPLTSSLRMECGLDQTHSVTVPLIVISPTVSNVAAP